MAATMRDRATTTRRRVAYTRASRCEEGQTGSCDLVGLVGDRSTGSDCPATPRLGAGLGGGRGGHDYVTGWWTLGYVGCRPPVDHSAGCAGQRAQSLCRPLAARSSSTLPSIIPQHTPLPALLCHTDSAPLLRPPSLAPRRRRTPILERAAPGHPSHSHILLPVVVIIALSILFHPPCRPTAPGTTPTTTVHI